MLTSFALKASFQIFRRSMRIPLAVSCQARRRNLNQAAKVQSEETESRAAILHSASQSEVLITHIDKKEKDNRRGCQWWRYSRGEDAHVFRLESKLADLRAEYAHTACGILPSEEKKLNSSSESAIRRNRIPSGNTPSCIRTNGFELNT